MKTFLPLLVVCCLLSEAAVATQQHTAFTPEERIQKALGKIIVRKLEFKEATLSEALDFLRTESRLRDPQGRGVPIFLDYDPNAPRKRGSPGIPSDIGRLPPADIPEPIFGPIDTRTGSPTQVRITISLTTIPLGEALKYMTALAEMKFWVRPDGIHIVAAAEPEPLFTRDIRIPSDYFSPLVTKQQPNRAADAAKAKENIVEYLRANGTSFPEGSAAILNDQGTRLTVRTTKEQADQIETLLKSAPMWRALPYDGHVPGPKTPKVIQSFPKTDHRVAVAMQAVKHQLKKIILPSVDLEHVALREAVRTLGMSRDPDVGIRVLVKETGVDGQPNTEPGAPDNPWISYTASKVSFWDALNAVARSGQFRVQVKPYGVVLEMIPPLGDLITREYLVPPNKEPSTQSPLLEEFRNPKHPSANNDLTSRGVDFAPTTSAIYIVKTNRLIVRHTEDYHRKVAELIEKGWQDYYASDEWKKRKQR